MSKSTRTTIITTSLHLLLIGLLFALLNPLQWFMTTSFEMVILAVFIVLVSIFLAAFWRERAGDERDVVHQMFAGRVAFFVAVLAMSLGVIIQVMQHNLDAWLSGALIATLLSKYIARWYAEKVM